MTKQLLATMEIGSGPRDPAVLDLLRNRTLDQAQKDRAVSFLNAVDALPTSAYGITSLKGATLAQEYLALAQKSPRERYDAAAEFVTKVAVTTLHNLGFSKAYNLEWGRTEMVEWECADVGGFSRSENWQHSYGTRFWKPREIVGEITYSGNSERHVEELKGIQKFATEQIRIPLTDPHCIIHANDNLFYYGKMLAGEEDESLAALKADHIAGVEFARKVSLNRARALSENARSGEKIAVQWDNFIVASEPKEFEKSVIKKMKLKATSYIELMKEITPSYPNIEYGTHNCLQPYHLYVPYVPAELPNVKRFHYEITTHDTNRPGLTADERTGQGWEAIKELKQYGLRKHQIVVIDVAPTYEGAQAPDPHVVRDRILYPILRLGYEPEQVEVAPACGQRNLSLERMLEIDVSIHRGRDLALKRLEREYKIDAEPHLTKSYLQRGVGDGAK